jgi:hypothetical protein
MIQVNLGHGVSRYFEILKWMEDKDIKVEFIGRGFSWPCILEMEEIDALALKLRFGL